jgi:tetratricopeptide (TPR) repeat protein
MRARRKINVTANGKYMSPRRRAGDDPVSAAKELVRAEAGRSVTVVRSCEGTLTATRIPGGALLKTFERFRKAVGRGTAALRGPTLLRTAFPGINDSAHVPAGPGSASNTTAAGVDDRSGALVRAGELLRGGHARQALELAQTWIQRDCADVEFRRVAGSAQKALGALTEAAEHLEFVLSVRGADEEILRALGESYDGLEQTADAICRWEMLVELTDAADEAALTALAIDLSRTGEHARAVALLQRVVSRRPDSGAAFADLGIALLESGRINEAVGAFSSARALDPMSAQAHCGLGLAYQGLERWHEATEAFAETERLAPESAVGPFNLGLTLGKLGDSIGMRRALLRAAAIEPEDREIRATLERLFLMAEQGELEAGSGETTQSASMSGSLKTFHLLDLVDFLRIQGKTGTLVISSRSGVGAIGLSRGNAVSVSAPGTKPLGDDLVARGLVGRAALAVHWTTPQSGQSCSDADLGATLCTAGLVAPDQLRELFLDRFIAGLEELHGWKEGTFSFHPGEPNEGRQAPLELVFDLQRLVLEMLRRTDERRVGTIRE